MENKRITLATIKYFIKKNIDKMFIQELSRFDGSNDGISHKKNPEFVQAKKDVTNHKNTQNRDITLGIEGAWFVGESRDYFSAFENEQFTGYKISNSCGSFILAIKKTEDRITTLSAKQYKSLEDGIYATLISAPDMGMGEMGECRDEAERIIKEWADNEQITIEE